jgi:hypothetical protein
MRYTGEKFTDAEAAAIMAEARARICGGAMAPTGSYARPSMPAPDPAPAPDDYWGYVDALIERKGATILEAAGQVIGEERKDFQWRSAILPVTR